MKIRIKTKMMCICGKNSFLVNINFTILNTIPNHHYGAVFPLSTTLIRYIGYTSPKNKIPHRHYLKVLSPTPSLPKLIDFLNIFHLISF